MPTMRHITAAQARRFHAHAVALDSPFSSVSEALHYLGYVQIDPIRVCGRMHDLILRNRVQAYAEDDLHRALEGPERVGFEHYLPGQGILVAFPFEAWPYLQPHLHARRTSSRGYGGKLSSEESAIADLVLREIQDRGPLGLDAIEHDGRALSAWGTHARAVKTVLEKLFFHGRVLIHSRNHFRRIYDLPERVLPPEVWEQPASDAQASARWLARLRLRQRRLAALPKAMLTSIADAVEHLSVEGCPTPLYCLREDLPLMDHANRIDVPDHVRLLAPLDPLIYDRKITSRVWNFDYSWEVYTPPAKRVRGYYALPVLSGDALVGHVDPKIDRKTSRLKVINRRVARGHATAPAVRSLARFLGVR
ncbi:MAG: crosslink repair DNA glycosylase YcaQ family protein [Puniceicoccaceae bacterium]